MLRAFGEHFSRRAVLVGGSAAFALARSATSVVAQSSNTPRQSVTGAGSAALASYKKAIKAMLALPPDDPRNWYRQAVIHISDCPHGNWWFLPWHRAYLANFESICRELSGDTQFALPFWDWTAAPSVPATFFQDELDPTNSAYLDGPDKVRQEMSAAVDAYFSGLTSAQREQFNRRGIASKEQLMNQIIGQVPTRERSRTRTAANPDFRPGAQRAVSLPQIKSNLAPSSFENFGSGIANNHHQQLEYGPLEQGAHNSVHGAVGGLMGAHMSPVDPIFWLHHCNLDRLWHLWTKKEKASGRSALPQSAAAWRNEAFLFFADAKGNVLTKTCADYVDSDALGVGYGPGQADDIVPPGPVAAIALPEARDFSGALVSRPLRLEREVSINARIPSELFTSVREAPQETATPELVARITLEPPADAQDKVLKVFMNCPYLDNDTPLDDPHYVGEITFFGHGGHGDHQQGSHTSIYTLPISRTVARLPAGRPNTGDIKIQIITEGPGEAGQRLDGAVKKLEISAV